MDAVAQDPVGAILIPGQWAFAPIGLLPVVLFLLLLVYLDSYRMVRPRLVVATIIAGGVVAGVCYVLNGHLMALLGMDLTHYSRWVAPIVEETCKALVMVWLFRTDRVGFLIDSAILGFAVGTGFALVENMYYLYLSTDTSLVVWLVRGFGTAVMHGGVVAIFAVMAQTLSERSLHIRLWQYLPGWLLAISVHSVFNHFFVSPVESAIGTLLILPPILYVIFRISEYRTHRWLEADFDEDVDLIRVIESGNFGESPVGRFLGQLRDRFSGTVVADMLCYLRLYTELALRAKGLLMMRESGLEVPMDAETKAKFTELNYLERSIGTTGCLMIRPFLQVTRKDLWQMYVLKD